MDQTFWGHRRRREHWCAAAHGGGVRLNDSRFPSRGDACDVANPTPCSVRGCSTVAHRDSGGADQPTPASDSRERRGVEKGRVGCLPPHEAPRHAVVEVAVQRINARHDELELGNGGGAEAELAEGALRRSSRRLDPSVRCGMALRSGTVGQEAQVIAGGMEIAGAAVLT